MAHRGCGAKGNLQATAVVMQSGDRSEIQVALHRLESDRRTGMRYNKKSKKAKVTSDKAILARVTEEMAQPRVAKSAAINTDKPISVPNGNPV